MPTLQIQDQTVTGQTTNRLTLDVLTERISVRELIRSRVYQEVGDYNVRLRGGGGGTEFRGLVQPSDTERKLNGHAGPRAGREIDWKAQFARACEACERNGFFVLVGHYQPTSLDEEIEVRHDTAISFVKLVPLVGG
jgi:hypothetical protein